MDPAEEFAAHDPGTDSAGIRAAALETTPATIRTGGGEVRVGTASWTDPTMTAAGVFYPPEARNAEDRLRYYATQFPVVEVDASYYAIPAPETARLWVERTPTGFVFDIKAHALMTGQPSEVKRLPKAIREALPEELAAKARIYGKDLPAELYDEVWAGFGRAIEPLREAGRLGAVFLQFPRWVFPSNQNRELILDARRKLGVEVAAEFRNASWFNEKNAERTLRFLEEHKVPYVMIDGPQGLKSSIPPIAAVTSPELAVIRFHGRRSDLWEKPNIPVVERFRYLYDEDQLADWVPRIREVARAAKQTHVLMNNCFGNYGTTNARELAALLRDQL
ncbi:MAG TPA: DUF72 domain-containing protein [Candidatus Dormibacteraeota bacterium]|jgi:uncharacterized protein YecE (DUF72 family)